MGVRRDVLISVRKQVNGLTLTGRAGQSYIIRAMNTFIDPLIEDNLPVFTVVADPETIDIRLFGTIKQRNMRINIIGFSHRMDLDTDLAEEDEEDLRESLFLTGEEVVDVIVQHLTSQATADAFHACSTTGGFAIEEIGPIFVEQFEGQSPLVYMSIPLSVVYADY